MRRFGIHFLSVSKRFQGYVSGMPISRLFTFVSDVIKKIDANRSRTPHLRGTCFDLFLVFFSQVQVHKTLAKNNPTAAAAAAALSPFWSYIAHISLRTQYKWISLRIRNLRYIRIARGVFFYSSEKSKCRTV